MMVLAGTSRVASAQQIEGRFYPEKQNYLVGEPIFVVLDLVNEGSEPVYIAVSCTWLDTHFEAPTVATPKPEVGLFGCGVGGWAGSCASSETQILPGAHYRRRYLLDGSFQFDSPGAYPIRAQHKVDIYSDGNGYQVIATQEVVSNFEVTLIQGSGDELAAAYVPLLREMKSSDDLTRSLAVSAIVQKPPPFLEDNILALADDPQTAAASVEGLEHLGTLRAKAKLAELCGPGQPECIRQMAVTTLGEMGDPAYCSLMLNIAKESHQYSRFIALRAAGYLCGENVLPLASEFLSNADASPRFEAAYALGNSRSRAAVALLIPLLLDRDPNVRRAASDALASLTHRKSKFETGDKSAGMQSYLAWTNWWASHRLNAVIYSIEDCAGSTPLQ